MCNWIKTNDILPESDSDVLLTYDGQKIAANIFYDNYKKKWRMFDEFENESDYQGKITHWYRFPGPPQKKKTKIIPMV